MFDWSTGFDFNSYLLYDNIIVKVRKLETLALFSNNPSYRPVAPGLKKLNERPTMPPIV